MENRTVLRMKKTQMDTFEKWEFVLQFTAQYTNLLKRKKKHTHTYTKES